MEYVEAEVISPSFPRLPGLRVEVETTPETCRVTIDLDPPTAVVDEDTFARFSAHAATIVQQLHHSRMGFAIPADMPKSDEDGNGQ